MKAWHHFIIVILFGAAIISCKKDHEIVGVVPENNSLNGFKTDTFSIETYSVANDSVASSSGTIKYFGAYHSSELGLTEVKLYTSLAPTTLGKKISPSSVLEKVLFSFRISETYGTANSQDFEIYKTSESVSSGKTYYIKDSLAESGILLGTINITSKDTGTFEFQLDDTFGDLLLAADTNVLKTEANFLNFFQGLVLRPKSTALNNNGVIFGIKASSIELEVLTSTTDTNSVKKYDSFVFSQSSSTKTFYQSKKNWTGSKLASGLSNVNEGNNTFYMQGIGGVKAKINFPSLQAWYKAKNLINKATLILPSQSANNADFTKASNLIFYDVSTTSAVPSSFDVASNSYRFEIQSFLNEDLVANYTTDYQIAVLNSYAHPEQLVLSGNKNSTNPAKLVIYYTTFK